MLFVPMLLAAFRPTKPENSIREPPLPQPEFRIPTRGTILSNPNHSGLHTFP